MKNSEKYTTPEARLAAFDSFCKFAHEKDKCHLCEIVDKCDCAPHRGILHWLETEAEYEKPLPCPFCGSRMMEERRCDYGLICAGCEYTTPFCKTIEEAIASHNRVAKASACGKSDHRCEDALDQIASHVREARHNGLAIDDGLKDVILDIVRESKEN